MNIVRKGTVAKSSHVACRVGNAVSTSYYVEHEAATRLHEEWYIPAPESGSPQDERTQFFILYRFLKRSTLPAVSTTCRCPVKKG